MIHNSSVRMAHEYGASREAFEKATQIMCTQVSIPVSDRYNSLYDEKDLSTILSSFTMATPVPSSLSEIAEATASISSPVNSEQSTPIMPGSPRCSRR